MFVDTFSQWFSLGSFSKTQIRKLCSRIWIELYLLGFFSSHYFCFDILAIEVYLSWWHWKSLYCTLIINRSDALKMFLLWSYSRSNFICCNTMFLLWSSITVSLPWYAENILTLIMIKVHLQWSKCEKYFYFVFDH